MRLKSILERNNVHACGMDVSKPICDYMANVSEHLIGGAPLKTLEAGDAEILIHMLPTALDNFLEKELKLLISMDIDDIEDPTPGCVNVLLQFLDVRSVFSNISCEFFTNLNLKYLKLFTNLLQIVHIFLKQLFTICYCFLLFVIHFWSTL